MNKGVFAAICNVIGVVLIAAFVVKNVIDYSQYDPIANSAPFSVWIITNALYFILPSLIFFVLGIIIKKKH